MLLGLVGMVWLLFLRYYTIAWEQRKNRVLSVRDDLTTDLNKDSVKVPWGTLFSSAAFWYVLWYCINHLNILIVPDHQIVDQNLTTQFSIHCPLIKSNPMD